MVRTKTPTALLEPEAAVATPPAEPFAKTPEAEPTTLSITAQHLADVLAGFAFALAAFGADSLSPEGRAAFRDIIGDLDNAAGLPSARYEIPADGASWIFSDLLSNRYRRPALTGGEVTLGDALRRQFPHLVQRLTAKAAGCPPREGGLSVPRASMESPVLITDPRGARYPNGQYFNAGGRPVGPKPLLRSTF